MRWTWLIPRLILVALIWCVAVFGMDPILRYSAVQSLQSATGARADIASLSTGLFPPALTVGDVALASASQPGTNLIAFTELTGHLAGGPLLRRSFVVEEARLTGVRVGTVRDDNGQLEKTPNKGPQEPSWLTQKLTEVGSEWMDSLLVDVRSQLDPETLEIWRAGKSLRSKWQTRYDRLEKQIQDFQPRVKKLQADMEAVRELPSVARIERHLQLAKEGEQLLQEAQRLQQVLQGVVPEAQRDILSLDTARKNDQQQIAQKVRQFTPSPGRITESLIGPQLYRQLHQTLTWLNTARDYRQQLKQQTTVVRHRGRDFEFPLINPLPGFLCRRLEMNGELSIDQKLAPFHAVLNDVTSDPVLLGKPTVFRLTASGDQPLQIALRYDATGNRAVTDLIAEFHQQTPRSLTVGGSSEIGITAALANSTWSAKMRQTERSVSGAVKLHAQLQNAAMQSDKVAPILQQELTAILQGIDQIDATLHIQGDLQQPSIRIESGVGRQIAAGLKAVFSRQSQRMQDALQTQLVELANAQKQRFVGGLNSRYQDLVTQHAAAQQQLQGARRLIASLQGGEANPGQLFRTISGSGLLPQKKEDKLQQQLDTAGELLKGFGGPRRR